MIYVTLTEITPLCLCIFFAVYSSRNNMPCVFPFEHLGTVYYDCTDQGGTEGIFWCGTQYMADDLENTDTDWGYCQLDGKL